MDKLEKFIHENRLKFDSEEPTDKLWDKIEDHVHPNLNLVRGKKAINYWRVAAIILLLVSAALVVDKIVFNKPVESGEYFITSEFQEAESFYLNLVSERKSIIEEKLKNDPEAKMEFLEEVEALDQKYDLLKGEIKYGNQEEILDALILNLQMRIEILNRQIDIIEKFKHRENEDENVTI